MIQYFIINQKIHTMPFEIFQSEKTSKYHFRLKAGNGEIILQSEAYNQKSSAENGVNSVINHSKSESNFEARKAANEKDYFVLKASNGEIIGKSQMYKTESGMQNGITSVMKNAVEGTIKDLA